MINELANKTRSRMEDTISSLNRDMDSISTGRATPSLLDTIKVEVYGSLMPIEQLANVSVPESSTLSVQVWDAANVKPTEKAIINSNLGFTPMIDGNTLRIAIPKLSAQRRTEMGKLAKKYGEDKKIALRNIRRDVLDEAKKNEDEVGKDKIHSFGDIVQKITDEFVKKIDEVVSVKEKELMTI